MLLLIKLSSDGASRVVVVPVDDIGVVRAAKDGEEYGDDEDNFGDENGMVGSVVS